MERIQKYVSACGLMSRRAAEKEIKDGAFTVNGKTAVIGQPVGRNDAVCYKGTPVLPQKKFTTVLLNKPVGYVTTLSDEKGRKTVAELIDLPERLYPAGRLDMDSEGMLIMTNDGELANRITHPSGEKKKVYHVWLRGSIDGSALDSLRSMRTLDGEKINPVKAELIRRSPDGSRISVTLTEGKNRQIRRMCEQCGLTVMQLRRVQIGSLRLGDLKPGEWRILSNNEVKELY